MLEDIRAIVKEHARLSVDVVGLAEDADLYQAGLTSHASVNLMLALEDKFGVEFPDRMLRRGVFGSLAAIKAAIEELTAGLAAPTRPGAGLRLPRDGGRLRGFHVWGKDD